MSIAVVTAWHNEAMIAPFFLSHYAYADKIHIVMGEDTTDESREICARYPNVEIEDFTFPDMLLDDVIKVHKMNECVAKQKTDWAYLVDADEFVFPIDGEDPEDVLLRQAGNLMYARLWNVFRHRTEKDLDPSKPTIWQRRHGNPDHSTPGAYKTQYVKPVIVRPEFGFEWYAGNHMCRYNAEMVVSEESFVGAHWQMADADMAIVRRIKGMKDRLSETNKRYGMSDQCYNLTEESIRAECERHLDDPQLF